MAPLYAGSAAPAFTLTDTKGNVLTLESLKGKKVYLILFRVAPCPLCNLTVSRLKKMAPELSKANMEIVCVFESTMSELKGYSGKQATDSFISMSTRERWPSTRTTGAFGLAQVRSLAGPFAGTCATTAKYGPFKVGS